MVRNARGHGRRVGPRAATVVAVAVLVACSPNPRRGDAPATTSLAAPTSTMPASSTTVTTAVATTTTAPAPTTTTTVPAGPVFTYAYVPHASVVLADAVAAPASGPLAVTVPVGVTLAVLAVRAEWSVVTTAPLATITVTPGPGESSAIRRDRAAPPVVTGRLVAPPDANALSGRVTVPVGADGTVAVQAPVGSTVSVTLVGGYEPAASTAAGRFVPVVAPTDAARAYGRGETRSVPVPDAVAADAVAVAVRVWTDGARPGTWTVVPGGAPADASVPVVDDATPGPIATAVMALDGARTLDVRTSVGGRARVDVVGWFTGPSAGAGAAGLYVPGAPRRVLDTRHDVVPVGAGGRAVLALPTDVLAAEVGVVARDPLAAGRVAVDGAPATPYAEGHVVAAPGLAVPSSDGRVAVTVADGAVHLAVDVGGTYVRGIDDVATLADRLAASVGTVEGRFSVPLDTISATAVPPEVIPPTSDATLDAASNPINGRRSAARPTTIGYGCTIDAGAAGDVDPRPCLVAMLDVLGFDVGGTTALDRQTRLQQAVAVVQLDAGLPMTGRPDDALYRYLGLAPGTERRDAAEVRTIGTTRQGRPITALRYGTGAKVVLMVGQTHGDEEAGLRVWLRARRGTIPKEVTLWVVPMASPDGIALDTRFLPGGHDPNRTAPSEPEQQAVYDFAVLVKPVLAVYYHQNYGWIGGSGASMDAARDYFQRTQLGSLKRSGDCAVGFLWCPIDDAVGSSSILVELPDVVTPDDVQRHAAALLAVAADVAAIT